MDLGINLPYRKRMINQFQRPAEDTPFEEEKGYSSYDDHQDCNDAQNQLAVCSPADTASNGTEFQPPQNQAYRTAPFAVTYTAQCSICSKWRFLPSKEKFEEVREKFSEQPFICAAVRQWHRKISCNDNPDLEQDASRLWAFERPNIARPPLGWERLLRIRASRASRFADVYYFTPSGKRLRSTAEVESYLDKHPDEGEGVDLRQFSFKIPKPLREKSGEEHTECVIALSRKRRRMRVKRRRKD